MTSKVSPKLASLLSTERPELLNIVVELDEGAKSRIRSATDMPSMRAAYAACAEPLKRRITQMGGNIVDELWLSSTLMAQMPANAVDRLSRDPGVSLLDVPVELERD